MFKMILYTQWKWSRLLVVTTVVIAFALPLLSVRAAGTNDATSWEALEALRSAEAWGGWFALLAVAAGLLMGTYAWLRDHRNQHVYALTLPVPRWYYALLRYGAGAVLLLAPIAALWISALVATAVAAVPPELNAYPNALALRFAFATLIAYSVFFAISAGTPRMAGTVLAAIAGLFFVDFALALADVDVTLLGFLFDRVVIWPGPFEVFTGRWVLIDV
ncbi:MAG: hypothetical protein PVF27_08690 [Gemmatimonadales bacterium]|jgi:hypothetical protein